MVVQIGYHCSRVFLLLLDSSLLVLLFELQRLLDLGVPGGELLEHLGVVVDDLHAVLLPVGGPQLPVQLLVAHQRHRHLLLVLDRPEDHRQEVQVVFRQQRQVSLVLPVLEDVLEGDDGRAEEVLERLGEGLALDQLIDLLLERPVAFLQLLLVVLCLLLVLLAALLDAGEILQLLAQLAQNAVLECLQLAQRGYVEPALAVGPVRRDWHRALQVPVGDELAENLGLFKDEVDDAALLVLEDGGGGDLVEQGEQGLAQLREFGVGPEVALLMVLDDGEAVLLEEGEGVRRRDAGVGRVVLHDRVEEDGGLVVLDQVLEIGVAAVLADQRPAGERRLEVPDVLGLAVGQDEEPLFGHQGGELVALLLVELEVGGLAHEHRDVLRGDDPIVSGGEVGDLRVFAVRLVEAVDVDLGLVLARQLVVAGEHVLDLAEDVVVERVVVLRQPRDVRVDDRPQRLVRNVEELHEPLPAPVDGLGLGVEDHGVAAADVVAVEGLVRVDLVLLRAARGEAEVDDGELLVLGVRVLDGLEGLAVFLQLGVDQPRLSDDLLQLPYRAELLLALCTLHRVPLVLVLDLLVGVQLHQILYCQRITAT